MKAIIPNAVRIFFFLVFLSGVIIIISYLLKINFLKFNEYQIFQYHNHPQTSATHQRYGNLVAMVLSILKLQHLHPKGFELRLFSQKKNKLSQQKIPLNHRLLCMNRLMKRNSIQQMHLVNQHIFLAFQLNLKSVVEKILN